MSIEVLFPLLILVVAAYVVWTHMSWRVIGSPDGKPAPAARPPDAAQSPRGFKEFERRSRFVPNEGFIHKARRTVIDAAEARLPGHIAIDRIQSRPGWLLFDPTEVVGEPPVVLTFEQRDSDGKPLEVLLYPLEQIRALESSNTYLAQCRRASISARWEDRRELRRARLTRGAQPPALTQGPASSQAAKPHVRSAKAG